MTKLATENKNFPPTPATHIPYYQLSAEQSLQRQHSSRDGLSQAEVNTRQHQYGPNALPQTKGDRKSVV